MAEIIDMPQLSDTMREGVLRRWLKNEGDALAPGDVLAEIETDKAVLEWQARPGGTLLRRLAREGATVPVGSPIAIVGSPDEDVAALAVAAQSRIRTGDHGRVHNRVPGPAPTLSAGDSVNPLSLMRKTIARRLLESKTSIPHFYLTTDVDADAALEFRDQVAHASGPRISMNDLVLKAAAVALRKVPQANASFSGDAIIQHARVDVGMAVAIEDGVVTPVIRDADTKTLAQVGAAAHDLAARARDRKLLGHEMTGATFSVSNLSSHGIDHFAAIINPPEAAILAVGRVRKEPVVRQGSVVVGHRMSLTLSCDHRVIDGAVGARLLQAIVAVLEDPATLPR